MTDVLPGPGCDGARQVEVTRLALPWPDPSPSLELLHAGPGLTLADLRAAARERSARLGSGRRVSRAYAFPYALLAHHDEAVGVDVEAVAPCDVVFAASICTPAELESLRVLDWARVISLWCSKEALAKALGDARLYDPRRLHGPAGWPRGESGPWRARPVPVGPDYRAWVCWRAPASDVATRARLDSSSRTSGP